MKRGHHDQQRSEVVRLRRVRRAAAAESSADAHASLRRQANSADQEAEQKHAGDGQRRDIDGTVLPQFAPHRPVQRPGLGEMTGGRDACESNGRSGHGVRLSIHLRRSLCLAVRLIAHHGNEQVGDAGRAHVAKRGELLTIDRRLRSNSRMLRPSTWRSCIGLSARAAATCSGCTITSR